MVSAEEEDDWKVVPAELDVAAELEVCPSGVVCCNVVPTTEDTSVVVTSKVEPMVDIR